MGNIRARGLLVMSSNKFDIFLPTVVEPKFFVEPFGANEWLYSSILWRYNLVNLKLRVTSQFQEIDLKLFFIIYFNM